VALKPRLRKGSCEEGRAVEDETVEIVSLAECDNGNVRMAAFEQATSVEVVWEGYRFVGCSRVERSSCLVVGRGASVHHGGIAGEETTEGGESGVFAAPVFSVSGAVRRVVGSSASF